MGKTMRIMLPFHMVTSFLYSFMGKCLISGARSKMQHRQRGDKRGSICYKRYSKGLLLTNSPVQHISKRLNTYDTDLDRENGYITVEMEIH